MEASLERLFRPKSIAVFGGREAARVVEQCDRMGFSGEVWPVHPTRDEVHGRRAFRSVTELPGAPDAAFIGVNRTLTVEVVRELSVRGAGGAICYASGFREAADGAALEDQLVQAAGEMPVIGPNCYGLINYLDGALLWPDQHGGKRVERGVAIVTQSSNIAINMTMQRRGLPIAYVATAGNQAQLSLAEIAGGLIEDARVTAVGLHIEGIADVAAFEAMARRARELRKPIVAMMVGRSAEARAATISHTASIAGSEAATAAFFHRLGIPRLKSIPEFLETLKLLHVHGPLPGGDLASMSCSGGEASIVADAAVGRKVRFRPLAEGEKARMKATLNDMVAIANPLDYHTFVWAKEAEMSATFSAMIGSGFDLSMLVLDFPRGDRCSDADWDIAVSAIGSAANETRQRVAVVASLPENMPEARAEQFLAAGIAPLCGIDDALAAAEAAAFIGQGWKLPTPKPLLPCRPALNVTAEEIAKVDHLASKERVQGPPTLGHQLIYDVPESGVHVYEATAKEWLSRFGLQVPRGRLVSPDEAVAAATELGYPLALKVSGVWHKSELNGVRLNLQNARDVAAAAEDFGRRGLTLLLVESMVTEGVAELLIGVTRDPQFGLLMTIAAGGVLVELLGDSVSVLLPASEEEIRAAILSLKSAPLLTGFRGRAIADIDAAVAAALAIGRYAKAHAETLEELDVNPLIVRPAGKGAVAVDALIRLRQD